MRWTLLAAALLLAACDATADPSPPPTPAPSGASAVPELRLPAVAAGATCPVTAPTRWHSPSAAYAVLGPGPVYPVADYFQPGPVLELRAADRNHDGSYTKKVRWIAEGYGGPVLVRAARIDGPGAAAVEFSYRGEERSGGWHAELTAPASDIPATTTVSGPGCYAYQVDGTGFRATVVFRAAYSGFAG